jgi:hypothetical protein
VFREYLFSFHKWVSKDGIVFVCMLGESVFALFVYVCFRMKINIYIYISRTIFMILVPVCLPIGPPAWWGTQLPKKARIKQDIEFYLT